MHLAAKADSVRPLFASKLPTAFMSPIVPMDIRSSASRPRVVYFFAICATSRRLCSMSLSRASSSPAASFFNSACSSSGVKAGGKAAFCCDHAHKHKHISEYLRNEFKHSIRSFPNFQGLPSALPACICNINQYHIIADFLNFAERDNKFFRIAQKPQET